VRGMTMSTAREGRRCCYHRQNCRYDDPLSHRRPCQSVSIAPTSASATVTPLTRASP
jgi:hypothetical protein